MTNPGQVPTILCQEDISFQTATGQRVTFHTDDCAGSVLVTVLYNPTNPRDARVEEITYEYLIGTIFIEALYGFLLIYILVYLLRKTRRRRREQSERIHTS